MDWSYLSESARHSTDEMCYRQAAAKAGYTVYNDNVCIGTIPRTPASELKISTCPIRGYPDQDSESIMRYYRIDTTFGVQSGCLNYCVV